jgi:hypothetical protein
MIQEPMTFECRVCGSIQSVRHGPHRYGTAPSHGKDAGPSGVLNPKPAWWETDNQTKLCSALGETRCRWRAVERIFDIPRQTVARWLPTPVQQLAEVEETLLPASADDIVERDEMGSCVYKNDHQRWMWRAMCPRRRHMVAFVIGDRSQASCLRFWKSIPDHYTHGHSVSDLGSLSRGLSHSTPSGCWEGNGGNGTDATLDHDAASTGGSVRVADALLFPHPIIRCLSSTDHHMVHCSVHFASLTYYLTTTHTQNTHCASS